MKVINDIDKMKTYAKIMKKDGKSIGFVPTMGCLHEGHLSLARAAKKQTDLVVLSVFVNKIQFGEGEDFNSYPRDITRDENLAKACGVDVMFCPKHEDMYPKSFSTYVKVKHLTENLCGKTRPGHFKGVTTVVAKFFEIIRPDIAYFGQKDAQQAFVIKRMIKDLNMDITTKIMPVIREEGGLAMSSRNSYLKSSERKDATCIHEALKVAEGMVSSGEKDSKKIIKEIKNILQKIQSIKIDYVSIVSTKNLKDISVIKGEALIAVAVFIGKTRLIDNVILNMEKKEDYGI